MTKDLLWTPSKIALVRLAAVFAFFQVLAEQERRFAARQLTFTWGVLTTACVCVVLVLSFLLLRHDPSSRSSGSARADSRSRFLAGVLLSCVAIVYLTKAAQWLSQEYWRFPISSYSADMLPLIRDALRDFWRDGVYPYHFYQMGQWALPLTFLPGLWLAYSPAHWLRVDLRYVSLFCTVAVSLIALLCAWRKGRSLGGFWVLLAISVAIAVCPFQPVPFANLHRILHLGPYWLAAALWAWATIEGWWTASAVCLAWATLCRPPFLAVCPFWFLFLWKNRHQVPWLRMLVGFAAAGLVLGLFFFCRDPRMFLYTIPQHYRRVAAYTLDSAPMDAWWIGWTGVFRAVGLYDQILWAGVLAVVAVFLWAIFRMRTISDLLAFSGVALTACLTFSLICWSYVYYDPLFVLFFAAWPQDAPLPPLDRRGKLLFGLAPLAVAAALTASMAAYHTATVGGHRSEGLLRASGASRTRTLWSHGWGARQKGKRGQDRRLVNCDASAAVPVGSNLDGRQLEIVLVSDRQPPALAPLLMVVYVNGERISKAVIQPGGPPQTLRFAVPKGNLFRGLNEVHLSFRNDLMRDQDLERQDEPLKGLALRSIRLAPVSREHSSGRGSAAMRTTTSCKSAT